MSVAPVKDFVYASNHAEKQPPLAYYVVLWRRNDLKRKSHMNTYTYMMIWEYLSKLMFATDDEIWIKGNKMRSENQGHPTRI